MYLPHSREYDKYWALDIETDSLDPTKIWCMCIQNIGTGFKQSFIGHDQIKRFFLELKSSEAYFVGHNSVSFDCYNINRLIEPDLVDLGKCVDTLVLSYLYDPKIPGGHSLASWGDRFKEAKGDFDQFDQFSEEMLVYCFQDVKITVRLFKALVERMRKMGFSELSCEIEHETRILIDEQQRNGWSFDIPGAQALLSRLRQEQEVLGIGIADLFPARLELAGSYTYRTRADGTPYASYSRHLGEYPEVKLKDDGTYDVFEFRDFNIGSPKQRLERLLEVGYEPVNFTPSGGPKVDEDSLVAFANSASKPEVQAIADWLVLQGRSSMIETWLNNVNYDDGRMHGRVMTCGAGTRRMIHNNPNSANIPKAKEKVKYGIECRRLWRATPGRKQVGDDASGLEMRMFAEYLKNDEATRLFIEGDPHLNNTRNLGLEDHYRDLTVKNTFYAYLYGAQDPKLGKTLFPQLAGGEARAAGKRARSILETGTPGLANLVAEIGAEFKGNGGVLRTIDGGFVRCPAVHAALNYKLQSAGAIVMKKAAILATKEIRRRGLDSYLVGTIHDENQNDSAPKDAEECGKVWVQGIRDAGVSLGFKVPLDGNYTVGDNWSMTH